MNLLELPPELVQLVFEQIVTSRSIQRAMRIRIVNRQFKDYIDRSICRLGLLSQLANVSYQPQWSYWPIARVQQAPSLSYLRSYILYQALRESSTTSMLGRIRRAANALCEIDGNTEYEAVLTCINSLVPLAMSLHLGQLLEEWKTVKECSNEDLNADIYIAAIYLGKTSYVESLIADGVKFCTMIGTPRIYSSLFGDALHAATIRGNLGMMRLILSCVAAYPEEGVAYNQGYILMIATRHGHQAAFDFALDMGLITNKAGHPGFSMLAKIIKTIPSRQMYERVAAILGPDNRAVSLAHRNPTAVLERSAFPAINAEMVRYFLDKGASPNYTKCRASSPLIAAIRADSETIFRMLFDAGADPNLGSPPNSALLSAVWKGNVSIVKLLLSRVSDINRGHPPPIVIAVLKENMAMFRLLREHGARLDTPETGGWAMAVAKLHGLSSMVDVLVHEGVGQEIVLHHVVSFSDQYWCYYRLWPRQ
ncbi:ankyrin [Xylaria telfairii]|nr:ankyrin [Xylaria telfairii]